jgi:hypothetical protein
MSNTQNNKRQTSNAPVSSERLAWELLAGGLNELSKWFTVTANNASGDEGAALIIRVDGAAKFTDEAGKVRFKRAEPAVTRPA